MWTLYISHRNYFYPSSLLRFISLVLRQSLPIHNFCIASHPTQSIFFFTISLLLPLLPSFLPCLLSPTSILLSNTFLFYPTFYLFSLGTIYPAPVLVYTYLLSLSLSLSPTSCLLSDILWLYFLPHLSYPLCPLTIPSLAYTLHPLSLFLPSDVCIQSPPPR